MFACGSLGDVPASCGMEHHDGTFWLNERNGRMTTRYKYKFYHEQSEQQLVSALAVIFRTAESGRELQDIGIC